MWVQSQITRPAKQKIHVCVIVMGGIVWCYDWSESTEIECVHTLVDYNFTWLEMKIDDFYSSIFDWLIDIYWQID